MKLATFSSCEWVLLKRFSRSEVKGQGHDMLWRRNTFRRCGVDAQLFSFFIRLLPNVKNVSFVCAICYIGHVNSALADPVLLNHALDDRHQWRS